MRAGYLWGAKRGEKRATSRSVLRITSGHPLRILPAQPARDWDSRDSHGTSKKRKLRVNRATLGAHQNAGAALERSSLEDPGRTDLVRGSKLVNMAGNAD